MIADAEFRVWAIRECAAMIRGMDSVVEAVAHLEGIADHLDVAYIDDATEGRPPWSPLPESTPKERDMTPIFERLHRRFTNQCSDCCSRGVPVGWFYCVNFACCDYQ